MKKIIYFLSIILTLMIINTSCYDRDVINSKDGISLPEISDLKFNRATDSTFTLTWTNPSNIPDEFNRPVSAYIQIYKRQDGELNYVRIISAEVAGEVNTYTTPPSIKRDEQYRRGDDVRATVKLKGNFKEPEYGKSNDVYSPKGLTVTGD
jgi:hypothetical protein